MKRTRELPVFPLSPDPVRAGVGRDVAPVHLEISSRGDPAGPRIALVTLGCDKNTVDSERMMAALVGHGARVSSEVDDAEVVIVNTCGFIQAAKEESIETILEACRMKEIGRLRAVVAVGCLVQRYKDELRREIPEVDLFMGLTELRGLVPELRSRGLLPAPEDVPVMERPLRILSTDTPHTSYLKISEGCDHACAFCAIPLMRGLHRSQPVEDLVREAAGLGARGVRELNIVSQDTTWYGRDLRRGPAGHSAPLLPDLLRALLAGTDIDWYRLFYMYPSGLTRELVELIATEARILPYLDMPIQHGSDRVLERMRRPERRRTIIERVGWLREAVPDLTLRTTVIVGFPGENDEDFHQLLEVLEEVRFERVGAFTYSVEEGTPAAEMADQVSESVRNERLEELMEVQRSISFEKNLEQVGRTTTLLIDRVVTDDPEYVAVGRTAAQAIDIDGVTHVLAGPEAGTGSSGRTVADLAGDASAALPSGLEAGRMVEVEIVDALDYDLVARVSGRGLTPPRGRPNGRKG